MMSKRYWTYGPFLLSLFTAPAVMAQDRKPPVGLTAPDIVVTGTPLKDAQAALELCIAQHCPPDQDITATLAVAETQFVAGDYRGARATMFKALGRDHRFAKDYPVPVSNLLRAYSRVAAHLGEEESYFNSARAVVTALKAGLPDTDWRVLGAQVELGDAFARTQQVEHGDRAEHIRQLDTAIDIYKSVAKRARALNLGRVEGYALLRVASVYAASAEHPKDGYFELALKACDALIANTDPGVAPFGRAAELLKAQLGVRRGDTGAVDRLITSYRLVATGSPTPILLYAPAIQPPDPTGQFLAAQNTLSKVGVDPSDGQWVDISFHIRADGTVAETELLRRSKSLSSDGWVKSIMTAIAGRRYAPLAPDATASFRVERYTITSAWVKADISRLRTRSPIPRIEVVDLSREPAKVGS